MPPARDLLGCVRAWIGSSLTSAMTAGEERIGGARLVIMEVMMKAGGWLRVPR
jgi:hypothetical protein